MPILTANARSFDFFLPYTHTMVYMHIMIITWKLSMFHAFISPLTNTCIAPIWNMCYVPHRVGFPDHDPFLWQTLTLVLFNSYPMFSSQTKQTLEPGVVPV